MGKRRLIWFLAILLAGTLYLFENNAGTLTVLLAVVFLPVFGLLPMLGRRIAAEIRLDTIREKGQTLNGCLTVWNPGLLPMPGLQMTVVSRNLRTGEQTETPLELSLLPKQKKQLAFTMECPHCGKVEIRVPEVRSADVFGLFARRLACGCGTEFTVVPQLFAPAVSLESQDMTMPDSDAYFQSKPGSDPGETFAIREYAPGDPIRKIHWKLSEKTDKTMVREFGLPVVQEIALLLETAGVQTPEEADAITEVFASVSSVLATSGIRHWVFWRDTQTDELREHPITAEDDFAVMLRDLLELPPKQDGSVAQRFTERYPRCPYLHVVIVGGQIPQGIRDLYNGNRVSVLLPGRDSIPEGLQPDGTHVLSFPINGYAAALCRLEV